jgi:hypothetical protein
MTDGPFNGTHRPLASVEQHAVQRALEREHQEYQDRQASTLNLPSAMIEVVTIVSIGGRSHVLGNVPAARALEMFNGAVTMFNAGVAHGAKA